MSDPRPPVSPSRDEILRRLGEARSHIEAGRRAVLLLVTRRGGIRVLAMDPALRGETEDGPEAA